MASNTKWRVTIICVLSLTLNVDKVMSSQEIMKKMTTGFSKALNQCKSELNLDDHIMKDFANYWKEDYALLNKDLGCAIMCMAAKLNLITEDLKMHHQNAHEFAKTHGADDDVAKQVVTMIHDCEKNYLEDNDECNRVLEIAKCFRTKIHDLKWAPSMEEILEEVMSDI